MGNESIAEHTTLGIVGVGRQDTPQDRGTLRKAVHNIISKIYIKRFNINLYFIIIFIIIIIMYNV